MRNKSFTLIEVLFAVIILALTLGITLSISGQAKGDLIRARERWIVNHALEQATEFFLLTSPEDLKIPDGLLPPGFHATCEIDITREGLPEFADVEEYRGWQLGVYTVNIFDRSGRQKGRQVVHKLLPKDVLF